MKEEMIIDPSKDQKEGFIGTIVFVIILIAITVYFFMTNAPLFYRIIFLIWIIASALYLLDEVIESRSYFRVNNEGIEYIHLLKSRSLSFQWDELKFIGRFDIYGDTWGLGPFTTSCFIICSQKPIPFTPDGKVDHYYEWPEDQTIMIGWRGDEFYREFLSYCGGERDIRE